LSFEIALKTKPARGLTGLVAISGFLPRMSIL
jgi:hypothetical protein